MSADASEPKAHRARLLLDAALELSADQRETFLTRECRDDPELLDRLLEILHFDTADLPEGVSLARGLADSDPVVWKLFLEQIRSRGPTYRRYRDRGVIARGGMAAIHKVVDKDLRRTLAMKVILPRVEDQQPADPDTSLGRFLEEAQVTSQLDHPGIVPIHDIGLDHQGHVFFTMKLVKGEDLRSVFDRVKDPDDEEWNETRALHAMLRVCEAMSYAHDKRVIHRDLKPANVMVGQYGQTYVMDWGLAKILGEKDRRDVRVRTGASTIVRSERHDAAEEEPDSPLITMDGDIVGTPAYMAPEQAEGRVEEMGPHSDVYAVGAMLYHLLTGYMPYLKPGMRISPRMLLLRVLESRPTPIHEIRRDVPPELIAICERAMAREIPKRYPTMVELAADLRAYLEDRVVQAYETGPVAELRKWVLRNRSITATAAAALLAIGLLVWWAFLRIQEERDVADRNAVEADLRATEAEQEKRKVLRMSDLKRLNDLLVELDALWPALPQKAPDLERWIRSARSLLTRRTDHMSSLVELRARGAPLPHPLEPRLAEFTRRRDEAAADGDDGASQALTAEVNGLTALIELQRDYDFGADTETTWWHSTLKELILALDLLAGDDPFGRTIRSAESRLVLATTIEKHSITFYREQWDAAIELIGDPVITPMYDGMRIDDQIGLVPLGPDPESGLWEFWHLPSGIQPERGADGRLIPTTDTGLVFVLLPGGTATIGARILPFSRPDRDAEAKANETTTRKSTVDVELDPFFLSKYEMTQGQWLRITGRNPSTWNPATLDRFFNARLEDGDLSHPVEHVTWNECRLWLGRYGLVLPTEAQWEYACRAGTDTPWWTGSERLELAAAANVADQFGKDHGHELWSDWETELDDGHSKHAPVGSYLPNPFGLHDTMGNVWEWCRDIYMPNYDHPFSSGDGVRVVEGTGFRVYRGGAYNRTAGMARSSMRARQQQTFSEENHGCRPARRIDTR